MAEDRDWMVSTVSEYTTGSEKVDEVIRFNIQRIWERQLAPLVNDALVSEHRSDPFGQHSLELDAVLSFLRNDPLRGKNPQYVIVCLEEGKRWVIGEHSRRRGKPVVARRGPVFNDIASAEHAVFCQRLVDLGIPVDHAATRDRWRITPRRP